MCFPSVFCRPIQTPFPGPKTYPANRVGMVYHTGTVPKGFSAHAGRLHARVQRSKLCTSSQPSRPWRKSAPFRVGYPLVTEPLSAPLQGGLRLLRRSSTPPPSPPLRSGYRRLAATGRVGLTLLSNGERRMGGGCVL